MGLIVTNLNSLSAIAATILIFSYSVPLSAQEYGRYCNSRFGFCVEYPMHFGIEPAPENNDGRRFYDRNGFTMTVSGINNALNNTLQSEMQSQSRDFDDVTYHSIGDNWYVLSGYKDTHILYLKTYMGGGSINHLYIKYPAQLKAEYDEIITRVSRSFLPGRIEDAH